MENISAAYSFLQNPRVPSFAPPQHFTVMDAACGLCAKGASWIAKHDHQAKFRIIPMQSALGRSLLEHYGMSADDPLSWLYVREGVAFTSLEAIMLVGKELGGSWRFVSLMRLFPRSVQNGLYGCMARNRYRMTSERSFCNSTDPEVQRRIMQ